MYQYFIAPLIGYFFGALPFAWIIVKLTTGQDIRDSGSGSVSTRNTVRTAGWSWAVLTGVLDITKGFLGVFLVKFVIFSSDAYPAFPEFLDLLAALAGIAAFAGHCWMPWMKFRGGKGFAVLSGALVIINPWGLLIWWVSLPIYLVIIRYSGISGLCSTASVAICNTFFYIFGATYWSTWPTMVFGWGCTLLITLRLIPDFIGMKKGEIKRWKGIKVTQWTR